MQCELVISTDLASEIYGFTLDESTGRPRDCIDLSQITDRIYLGSYEAGAKMYEGLRLFGITHILTVGNDMPPEFLDQFTYKVIELQDHHRVDISVHFEECFEFIRTALSQDPNNVILIHCFAGVSRSATVTIAYLMQSFCMSYPEACEHVRKARHWIDPNRGFRARLKELAQGLNLYDEAQAEWYENVSKILREMHEKKTLRERDRQEILCCFDELFGAIHPHTLDVNMETQQFVSTSTL